MRKGIECYRIQGTWYIQISEKKKINYLSCRIGWQTKPIVIMCFTSFALHSFVSLATHTDIAVDSILDTIITIHTGCTSTFVNILKNKTKKGHIQLNCNVLRLHRTVDYMTRLVNQIPIGPDDFQIALVSYTFDPKLVFNFTTHLSNSSLVDALSLIKSERGPTMTSKALLYASQVNVMSRNRDSPSENLHFWIDLNENKKINKFMQLLFVKTNIID